MKGMEVVLVLDNIRSTYNVGAILRTFEGFGGTHVVCSGVTPCFVRPGLLPHLAEKLEHQIGKTALGAEKTLRIEYSDNILEFLQAEKTASALILGLENNLSDSRVIELSRVFERLRGCRRVVLVLGEEVSGISTEVREVCDLFAEIPMRGKKESFNVSVAAGIALYELMGA